MSCKRFKTKDVCTECFIIEDTEGKEIIDLAEFKSYAQCKMVCDLLNDLVEENSNLKILIGFAQDESHDLLHKWKSLEEELEKIKKEISIQIKYLEHTGGDNEVVKGKLELLYQLNSNFSSKLKYERDLSAWKGE